MNYQRIGIGISCPTTDMEILGEVKEVEGAMYTYADVKDVMGNSMLAIPLLHFVGKRVRIRVDVLEAVK